MSERAARAIERWLPAAIVAALLALRLVLVIRGSVDSDEPQHLHVIYGWAQGELPYLDRFDNHTPLFAWLFIPLARLAGESPNVVLWARLAELPFSFGLVALLGWLGARLYGRRVALWTVAITLALADWSAKSVEFRPDVLWTFLFFAALLVLSRREGAAGAREFFAAGVLLGAAMAASIKTPFLLAGLALGWAAAWGISPRMREVFPPGRIAACALAAIAGFLLVPGAFVAWFAAHGALPAMAHDLFTVNQPDAPGWRAWFLVPGIPAAVAMAFRLRRGGWICAAVFLAAAFYALLIAGLSPSLKKQTFLPAYPLLVMAAVAVWKPRSALMPAGLCALLAGLQIFETRPWRDGMAGQRDLLAGVLAATDPGDYVLDLKGETVFRKRPVRVAYVLATDRGMEAGRVEEADPRQLSETGTAVVVGNGMGFPQAMRKFMKDFYVPVGTGLLRVAGRELKPSWENGAWIERADMPVAGEYVLLRGGELAGTVTVDAPGAQVFDFGTDSSRVLLFWKRAWDRGLRPSAASNVSGTD